MSASSSWAHDGRLAPPWRWLSAHLYYHDDSDELLRQCVRPLVGELTAAGLIDGFCFVRYWQGGRHVRLRVLLTERRGEEQVAERIDAHAGRFFAACPSHATVGLEDYLRTAGWLSRHEFGRQVTIEPLQPDNSLRYSPYVPEYRRLGGPAGVAAVEPHFVASSGIALDLLAATPSRGQHTGRALAMMLLAGAVLIPDRRSLARFFRACYRGWASRLTGGAEPDELRQRYDRQRDQLGDLVRQLLGEAARPGDDHRDDIITRWLACNTALRDRLWPEAVTAPLLWQCLHKHNNRLGISLAEEVYLLFLLHRTLAEDPR